MAGAAAAPIIRCRRVIAEPRSMKCHWSDAQSGIDRDRAEGDSCLRSLSGRRGGLGIEEGGGRREAAGGGGGGTESDDTNRTNCACNLKKKKNEKMRRGINGLEHGRRTDRRSSATGEFHQHTNGCGDPLIAHQVSCRETAADHSGSRKKKIKRSDVTATSSTRCTA